MVTSSLLRLLLRTRSSVVDVRRRAIDELAALDPDVMSLADLGALVTFIPDLIDKESGDVEGARLALQLMQRDLGGLQPSRFERIYPYLPSELGPLVIGALARQRRPESWLGLRRVLHLELSQPEHEAPDVDTLGPLGEICHEPTFVIDAILEAIDDPLWTTQALHVIAAWTDAGVLSGRDIERCREKMPMLEELLASHADADDAAELGDGEAWPVPMAAVDTEAAGTPAHSM